MTAFLEAREADDVHVRHGILFGVEHSHGGRERILGRGGGRSLGCRGASTLRDGRSGQDGSLLGGHRRDALPHRSVGALLRCSIVGALRPLEQEPERGDGAEARKDEQDHLGTSADAHAPTLAARCHGAVWVSPVGPVPGTDR